MYSIIIISSLLISSFALFNEDVTLNELEEQLAMDEELLRSLGFGHENYSPDLLTSATAARGRVRAPGAKSRQRREERIRKCGMQLITWAQDVCNGCKSKRSAIFPSRTRRAAPLTEMCCTNTCTVSDVKAHCCK